MMAVIIIISEVLFQKGGRAGVAGEVARKLAGLERKRGHVHVRGQLDPVPVAAQIPIPVTLELVVSLFSTFTSETISKLRILDELGKMGKLFENVWIGNKNQNS